MSQTRVAINGFGRIGRILFRHLIQEPNVDIVAINCRSNAEMLAHLLKYDSIHGRFQGTISPEGEYLVVNGKKTKIVTVKDPQDLPWKELDIDIAVESTGAFRNREGLTKHLTAGAKRVLLTAPASKKEDVDATIVLGVNEDKITADTKIISCASCTTNCLAPVAKVLHEKFGIKRGLINTIHSYTKDQNLMDGTHKDLRRARAAAMSIIPTSTGAAKAVGIVIPELQGKLDGFAMRVPTADGSVVDLTCELNRDVTVEEVNQAIKEAAEGSMKHYIEYNTDPIVSIDIVGNPYSSIFDAPLTKVMDGNFVKVVIWYDNEFGYSKRVAEIVTSLKK